jgi:hypothetical protein
MQAGMRLHFTRVFTLLALLMPVAAVADAPPPLAALAGFRPGAWQVKAIGATDSVSHCLADPAPMLTTARPAQACQFRIIADQPDSATVTYRCAGGRQGRTAIRRDARGLFVVDAQGLENGHPFADRTEWRRTGDC